MTVDLHDLWEGRINGLRFDFATPEAGREFDICYMGFFRSEEEGVAFCEARLAELGVIVNGEQTQETVTTAEEAVTEAPTEAVTEGTTVAATEAPTAEPKTEGGCGSVIGQVFTGVGVLLLSCGIVLRKRED